MLEDDADSLEVQSLLSRISAFIIDQQTDEDDINKITPVGGNKSAQQQHLRSQQLGESFVAQQQDEGVEQQQQLQLKQQHSTPWSSQRRASVLGDRSILSHSDRTSLRKHITSGAGEVTEEEEGDGCKMIDDEHGIGSVGTTPANMFSSPKLSIQPFGYARVDEHVEGANSSRTISAPMLCSTEAAPVIIGCHTIATNDGAHKSGNYCCTKIINDNITDTDASINCVSSNNNISLFNTTVRGGGLSAEQHRRRTGNNNEWSTCDVNESGLPFVNTPAPRIKSNFTSIAAMSVHESQNSNNTNKSSVSLDQQAHQHSPYSHMALSHTGGIGDVEHASRDIFRCSSSAIEPAAMKEGCTRATTVLCAPITFNKHDIHANSMDLATSTSTPNHNNNEAHGSEWVPSAQGAYTMSQTVIRPLDDMQRQTASLMACEGQQSTSMCGAAGQGLRMSSRDMTHRQPYESRLLVTTHTETTTPTNYPHTHNDNINSMTIQSQARQQQVQQQQQAMQSMSNRSGASVQQSAITQGSVSVTQSTLEWRNSLEEELVSFANRSSGNFMGGYSQVSNNNNKDHNNPTTPPTFTCTGSNDTDAVTTVAGQGTNATMMPPANVPFFALHTQPTTASQSFVGAFQQFVSQRVTTHAGGAGAKSTNNNNHSNHAYIDNNNNSNSSISYTDSNHNSNTNSKSTTTDHTQCSLIGLAKRTTPLEQRITQQTQYSPISTNAISAQSYRGANYSCAHDLCDNEAMLLHTRANADRNDTRALSQRPMSSPQFMLGGCCAENAVTTHARMPASAAPERESGRITMLPNVRHRQDTLNDGWNTLQHVSSLSSSQPAAADGLPLRTQQNMQTQGADYLGCDVNCSAHDAMDSGSARVSCGRRMSAEGGHLRRSSTRSESDATHPVHAGWMSYAAGNSNSNNNNNNVAVTCADAFSMHSNPHQAAHPMFIPVPAASQQNMGTNPDGVFNSTDSRVITPSVAKTTTTPMPYSLFTTGAQTENQRDGLSEAWNSTRGIQSRCTMPSVKQQQIQHEQAQHQQQQQQQSAFFLMPSIATLTETATTVATQSPHMLHPVSISTAGATPDDATYPWNSLSSRGYTTSHTPASALAQTHSANPLARASHAIVTSHDKHANTSTANVHSAPDPSQVITNESAWVMNSRESPRRSRLQTGSATKSSQPRSGVMAALDGNNINTNATASAAATFSSLSPPIHRQMVNAGTALPLSSSRVNSIPGATTFTTSTTPIHADSNNIICDMNNKHNTLNDKNASVNTTNNNSGVRSTISVSNVRTPSQSTQSSVHAGLLSRGWGGHTPVGVLPGGGATLISPGAAAEGGAKNMSNNSSSSPISVMSITPVLAMLLDDNEGNNSSNLAAEVSGTRPKMPSPQALHQHHHRGSAGTPMIKAGPKQPSSQRASGTPPHIKINPPLHHIYQRVLAMSRDQQGCRLLQAVLDYENNAGGGQLECGPAPTMNSAGAVASAIQTACVSPICEINNVRNNNKDDNNNYSNSDIVAASRRFAESIPTQRIVAAVEQDMANVMSDAYGNFLVQKILEVAPDVERARLLLHVSLTNKLSTVAASPHGTFAVQRLIETLRNEAEEDIVFGALQSNLLHLLTDVNGGHVLYKMMTYIKQRYLTSASSNYIAVASTTATTTLPAVTAGSAEAKAATEAMSATARKEEDRGGHASSPNANHYTIGHVNANMYSSAYNRNNDASIYGANSVHTACVAVSQDIRAGKNSADPRLLQHPYPSAAAPRIADGSPSGRSGELSLTNERSARMAVLRRKVQFLYRGILDHLAYIAQHKQGCCILQKCLDFFAAIFPGGEPQRKSTLQPSPNADPRSSFAPSPVVSWNATQAGHANAAQDTAEYVQHTVSHLMRNSSKDQQNTNSNDSTISDRVEQGDSRAEGGVDTNYFASIVHRLISHILKLAVDPFGNYVVTHAVEVCHAHGYTKLVDVMARSLQRELRVLCRNKFASNVVEHVIRFCSEFRVREFCRVLVQPLGSSTAGTISSHTSVEYDANELYGVRSDDAVSISANTTASPGAPIHGNGHNSNSNNFNFSRHVSHTITPFRAPSPSSVPFISPLIEIALDQYGNYVVQTLLMVAPVDELMRGVSVAMHDHGGNASRETPGLLLQLRSHLSMIHEKNFGKKLDARIQLAILRVAEAAQKSQPF